MPRHTLPVLFAVLFAPAGEARAQATKSAQKPPDMEKLREMMKPGPEHAALAKYAGKWDVEVGMGGGKSAGSAEAKTTVGGRFFQIDYETKAISGLSQGSFTIGFDRRHGHYTLIAMDDTGTYWVTSQGKKDEKTGQVKLAGKDDDPMMKAMGFTKEFVHVLDFQSADAFAIEVRFVDTRTAERKEIKAMEIKFARKK